MSFKLNWNPCQNFFPHRLVLSANPLSNFYKNCKVGCTKIICWREPAKRAIFFTCVLENMRTNLDFFPGWSGSWLARTNIFSGRWTSWKFINDCDLPLHIPSPCLPVTHQKIASVTKRFFDCDPTHTVHTFHTTMDKLTWKLFQVESKELISFRVGSSSR